MTPHPQSVRCYLAQLEARDWLKAVADPVAVELALATRIRAERDLLVVPGAKTNRSDPLESDGAIAKLGIDATRKPGDRDDWRAAAPPAEVMQRIARKIP